MDRPDVTDLVARCRFPPPATAVTCAVSGGADSLALLVLAVAAGCEVTAVHVDHGLRPGSAAEADVVRSAAHHVGAAFRAVAVDVAPGPNLEARARAARYAALPADVLTGHTADDQAETVLLHLMRGAGVDGLAAMRPDRRPLLALRRTETVALCSALDLDVVHDPSNHDPAHLRNRVRHELVPVLAELSGRDPVPVLARQASLLRDDAVALDAAATGLDPRSARSLAGAPVALARRAVRRHLAGLGWSHPPDAATVARVLAVASGDARAADLLDGWRIERSRGRLLYAAPPPAAGAAPDR